ncbi:MAG: hypothetical protein EXS02_11540 [Planctomycetes bacterium]|nr:hypothetical protein [Planctomycetota bacterium]
MRRSFVGMCVALFSLQGCLQMEQTVTFTADGSGQHDLVMTLPESVLQEIKRSAAGNQTSTAVDPLALFNKDSVEKELKAAGIELVRHAPETIGKSRRVVIATKFSAPDALAKSPLLGSAAEWEFVSGEQSSTTRVTLYPQGKKAWAEARARALSMRDAPDALASDFFAKRKAQFDGLDVVVRFRVPGKVIEFTRNLELTGPCEVTARITAEQIKTPEDLVRRLAPRFELIFDSSSCTFPVAARD